MESSLWSLLGQFLGTDQFRARIVASSMPSLTQKISLLERLSNTYLPEDEAAKLNKLLKRVKKLSRRRNLLAHESMHINEAEDKNIVFKDSFDETG